MPEGSRGSWTSSARGTGCWALTMPQHARNNAAPVARETGILKGTGNSRSMTASEQKTTSFLRPDDVAGGYLGCGGGVNRISVVAREVRG